MEIRISAQAEIALKSIVRNAEIDHPVMVVLIKEDWRLGIGIYEKSTDMKDDEFFSVGPFLFLLDEPQATALDGKTIDCIGGKFVAIEVNET